jgi:hypothetical protein
MFYALRRLAESDRETLVEFSKQADMQAAIAASRHVYSIVRAAVARNWVRQGKEHETGLYIDGTRIRYAKIS